MEGGVVRRIVRIVFLSLCSLCVYVKNKNMGNANREIGGCRDFGTTVSSNAGTA